ncbi:hypothetical protein Kisp02_66580 [Kineosporia sp. NBRC 101731]|nr:hypothetical protein Kisp02_66580 [Kineosporia sp. NBRC 101731]
MSIARKDQQSSSHGGETFAATTTKEPDMAKILKARKRRPVEKPLPKKHKKELQPQPEQGPEPRD